MRAEDDPSWAAYAETLLALGPVDGDGVADTDGVAVDLREALTPNHRVALAGLGLQAPFAVLTAHNPRGRIVDAEENGRRGALLVAALARAGVPWIPAVGMSPDGSHREPGVAAHLPLPVAARTAAEWEQSAFFWFDGDVFWLVGALVDAPPARLPVPRHGNDAPSTQR